MYNLWVLHYSLVKGVYRKRWKGMTNSVDGLAFFCLFVLLFFLFVLVVDKVLLWELIRGAKPLQQIIRIVMIIFVPIMFFLLSRGRSKHKINTIKKVLGRIEHLEWIYSVLYIVIYGVLFFLSLLMIAMART